MRGNAEERLFVYVVILFGGYLDMFHVFQCLSKGYYSIRRGRSNGKRRRKKKQKKKKKEMRQERKTRRSRLSSWVGWLLQQLVEESFSFSSAFLLPSISLASLLLWRRRSGRFSMHGQVRASARTIRSEREREAEGGKHKRSPQPSHQPANDDES